MPRGVHRTREAAISVGSTAAAGTGRDAPPVASAPAKTVPAYRAVFIEGSILRHVLVMTLTSTIGVLAIFLVDFLSLLYVSRLQQTDLTASVGLATQVLFYPISINIGLTISVTALVARALGAGERDRARRLATSGLTLGLIFSAVVAAVLLYFVTPILTLLGAKGDVLFVASRFLEITLPANVLFAAGMVLSGVLRAVGDARRAMYVTLIGGIVTGIVDPILIFGLHFGVYGAAMSTVISRLTFVAVGWHGASKIHDLVGAPRLSALGKDFRRLMEIALPAIGTNLATPVASSYVFHVLSRYGDAAIAATAVTDRVANLSFAVIFALSGAVGPILGQNLGARKLDRVRATLTKSFLLTAVYGLTMWFLLWLIAPLIVMVFGAKPEAARYIAFFCTWGVMAWLFVSFLFVANASFNNLGFPILSLLFNWGRASLGTIPFVTLGAAYGGVEGGQLGIAFGAAIFGLLGLVTAYVVTARLATRMGAP